MNGSMLELVRMLLGEAYKRCDALCRDKELLKCQLSSAYDDLDVMRAELDLECKHALDCMEANDRLRAELLQVRGELAQTVERLRTANKDLEKLRLSKEV